jgi:hypothetical protein
VFISLLQSGLTRSTTNYFWCTNAKKDELFALHSLLGIRHEQMHKILHTFNFVGSTGSVTNSGSSQICSLVRLDHHENSKHKINKEINRNADNGKSATDQRYFIGLGIVKGTIQAR